MATSQVYGGVFERKSHKTGRNAIRKITRIVGGTTGNSRISRVSLRKMCPVCGRKLKKLGSHLLSHNPELAARKKAKQIAAWNRRAGLRVC